MIWKRLGISMGAVLAIVGLVAGVVQIAGHVAEKLYGSTEAAMMLFPYLAAVLLAGLFVVSVLCGVFQPSSHAPWRDSFLFSPGTWVGLWMVTRPDIRSGFLWAACWVGTPVLVGWLGCRLGMQSGHTVDNNTEQGGGEERR